MRLPSAGSFWLTAYAGLVFAPVLILLVEPMPPGLGWLHDLSVALGFAGLSMMAMQWLVTARFRRAAAPFGIDVLYYFHRYLGIVILAVVLAHPVLLVIENPAIADFFDPRLAPWPMTAGVASTLALVVLMVTSLLRKPLRIPYERWRIFHTLLAAGAVGLGLVHMEGVQYYSASPWTHALWRTVAASWVAVAVYVRLVKPWRLRSRPYRVTTVSPERGDAWTLTLEPIGHAGITFRPGQFAWLTLRASPFQMRDHPFSFSSSPVTSGGRVAFTIKALGDFTETVGTVTAGETAWVDAPYGSFSIDRYPAPGHVFIAGGIGVAPLMSMLRAMADRHDPRPVLLVYACRRWERMTFREDISSLQQRLSLDFVPVLEEPPEDWQGERGRITVDLLDRRLPSDRLRRQYFICGPEAMTQAVEHQLHALGLPQARIHSELFDLA